MVAQVYFKSHNKMDLAVLKTKPNKYLFYIPSDKGLKIYFLEGWGSFPLLPSNFPVVSGNDQSLEY